MPKIHARPSASRRIRHRAIPCVMQRPGIWKNARKVIAPAPGRAVYDRVAKPDQIYALVHSIVGAAIESRSAGCQNTERLTIMTRPDQLIRARFIAPSRIAIEFADGRRFSLDAVLLGMPMDRIDWSALKASPRGEKIVVRGIKGDAIPIDSATLRYLVDNEYATKIDKSIRDLHLTPAEQEKVSIGSKLTRDQRWYDVGDEDDLCE